MIAQNVAHQDDWEAARRFIGSMLDREQRLTACTLLTEAMCRWATMNGVMGQFLLKSMDSEVSTILSTILYYLQYYTTITTISISRCYHFPSPSPLPIEF